MPYKTLIDDKDEDRGKQKEKDPEVKGKKILIAEDDMFLRELCTKKLNETGFIIETALDGAETLAKIINTKPDLVLLDILMPSIGGFEILEKIRNHKDKSIAKIPIIIFSNLGQDEDIEKGIRLGANDYLIKANSTIDDVIVKIKEHLR